MSDMNQVLSQLTGGRGADPQLLSQMQALAGIADCQSLAAQLGQQPSAGELRQAVEQGDADRIRQAVGSFLATPEGARLAEQLRQALGK